MTKNKIFKAAKDILRSEGVEGITIRKVADRAGMSAMGIYRHFADKEALLNALMDDGLTRWEEIARAVRAPQAMAWLDRIMEAFLDFALTEPHRFDAAFFLPAPKARRYPDDFAARRSPVVALMMARIEEAKTQGKLGDRPAVEIALALAALAQGLISMQRANRFASERQFKALYRTAMRHSLQSFAAEPGSNP
jgi:AcrR family transcriptional regulator